MKKSKYKSFKSKDKKMQKFIKCLKGESKIVAFINRGIKNLEPQQEEA